MATASPDTATTSLVAARSDGEVPERLLSVALCSDAPGRNNENGYGSGRSMNWVSVDSSVFASVAYRGDERQLFLRFHSGKVYRYFGFPPDQYDELLAAESKGGYFAESIRGKFLYEEVREAHGSAG